MVNILVGCTGSVAAIKLPILVSKLLAIEGASVRIVVTEHAKHFYNEGNIVDEAEVYTDSDEWYVWQKRGDPVLHIELAKWADCFLVAPLDANTLAKMANVCIKMSNVTDIIFLILGAV